jgi:hypothetical protein
MFPPDLDPIASYTVSQRGTAGTVPALFKKASRSFLRH